MLNHSREKPPYPYFFVMHWKTTCKGLPSSSVSRCIPLHPLSNSSIFQKYTAETVMLRDRVEGPKCIPVLIMIDPNLCTDTCNPFKPAQRAQNRKKKINKNLKQNLNSGTIKGKWEQHKTSEPREPSNQTIKSNHFQTCALMRLLSIFLLPLHALLLLSFWPFPVTSYPYINSKSKS